MKPLCLNFAVILFVVSFSVFGKTQFVEENKDGSCSLSNGQTGKCTPTKSCPYAIELIKSYRRPELCAFQGRTPIACCPVENLPGEKSQAKCKEYHKQADDEVHIFVVGGDISLAKEFPHMAAIGFGYQGNVQWLCGGALISENFVLTAAHCLYSRDFGEPTNVRLGDLDLENTKDDAQPQDFSIRRIIPHPGYRSPSKYNDIGLLQLDRSAKFTEWVRPACLYTQSAVPGSPLQAIGWGKTEFSGQTSSILMKVNLPYVPPEKCASDYSKSSPATLPNGILGDSQICTGGSIGKDTCQGDSGGPLQTTHPKVKYNGKFVASIVGITSFGKACGLTKSPGVYTRVSAYVPWIEGIVWPNLTGNQRKL